MVKETEQRKESDDMIVKSWEGFQISAVAIPADASVGINRSKNNTAPLETTSNMSKEERSDVSASSDAPVNSVVESMTANPKETLEVRSEVDTQKVIKAERSRIQEIQTVAAKYNLQDLGETFIKEDRSVADFNSAVLRE